MEIETLFSDSRWEILSLLSNASLSPTELAEKTGTSVANISSQLRLLEALDFIQKEKLSNVAKGEPRKIYSLKKEFAYLILGTKSLLGKKMFKLDQDNMVFFTVWLINESNVPNLLIRLFLDHEALLKDATSFGYLSLKNDELEVIILVPNPAALQGMNDKAILRNDKVYKVKAHIHSKEEFIAGISNKDDYFVSMLRKVFIISDRDNLVARLKKGAR